MTPLVKELQGDSPGHIKEVNDLKNNSLLELVKNLDDETLFDAWSSVLQKTEEQVQNIASQMLNNFLPSHPD